MSSDYARLAETLSRLLDDSTTPEELEQLATPRGDADTPVQINDTVYGWSKQIGDAYRVDLKTVAGEPLWVSRTASENPDIVVQGAFSDLVTLFQDPQAGNNGGIDLPMRCLIHPLK